MTNIWRYFKKLFNRFRDLTHVGVANIVSTAIAGIFWFYVAKLMDTESYGEVSYFIAIASVGAVISTLGMSNAMIIYVAKNVKIQSPLYTISLISSSVAAIIVFLIFYNIGISFFVLGSVLFSLVASELLGLKLYKKYSNYLILQKIFLVGFSIGFFYLIGPQGIILGFGLSYFPLIARSIKSFKEKKIELSLVRQRFGFLVNSYVLDLTRVFVGYTDKLIVGPFLGFALLGNYHLGYQFLVLLNIIPTIVYQFILPREASGLDNKKLKKVTVIFSVFSAILGIALGPIVLTTLFPQFEGAANIIQIMSLATIPITINMMYIPKLLGLEKVKLVLIGSGIFISVQAISIFTLGVIYEIQGVAIATVLGASSEAIYLIIINRFTKLVNE